MMEYLIKAMPGKPGFLLRRLYWKRHLVFCGSGLILGAGVTIDNPASIKVGDNVCIGVSGFLMAGGGGRISLGDNVATNSNVRIDASMGGRITIGNSVIIGPNTVLRASTHRSSRLDIPIRNQGHIEGIINIDDDVWIGANAFVGINITIGKGAIIGANSVVTHNIEPYSIVGGVPAKFIKMRQGPPDTLENVIGVE